MSSDFDLTEKIIEFLEMNEGMFSAREIAERIFKTYPNGCESKRRYMSQGKEKVRTDKELIRQISAEVSSKYSTKENQEKPRFKRIKEGKLLKYYFSGQSIGEHAPPYNEEAQSEETQEQEFSEHDLYPKLIDFLYDKSKLNGRRIDEKRSKNSKGKGGNKWLFPDLVAMQNLAANWHEKTQACVKQYSDQKTKLWSFEVKIKITRSNIREAFFQAVSNSSWANYGYLVAADLDNRARAELQILSDLHGIGFILLNSENPSKSEFLIPARERPNIDWNTVNRLVEENENFRDFIQDLAHFHETGRIDKFFPAPKPKA